MTNKDIWRNTYPFLGKYKYLYYASVLKSVFQLTVTKKKKKMFFPKI